MMIKPPLAPLPFPEIEPFGVGSVRTFRKFRRVAYRLHCATLFDDRARSVTGALSKGPTMMGAQISTRMPVALVYLNSRD